MIFAPYGSYNIRSCRTDTAVGNLRDAFNALRSAYTKDTMTIGYAVKLDSRGVPLN